MGVQFLMGMNCRIGYSQSTICRRVMIQMTLAKSLLPQSSKIPKQGPSWSKLSQTIAQVFKHVLGHAP